MAYIYVLIYVYPTRSISVIYTMSLALNRSILENSVTLICSYVTCMLPSRSQIKGYGLYDSTFVGDLYWQQPEYDWRTTCDDGVHY